MTAEPIARRYRLPILATLAGAYGAVARDAGTLAGLAFLPVLALTLLGALAKIIGWDEGARALPLAALFVLVGLAGFITFSVACLRRLLIGPEPGSILSALAWRRRHWSFLRTTTLLLGALVAGTVGAVLLEKAFTLAGHDEGMDRVLLVGMFVGWSYVLPRIAMMLPAAAVDATASFVASWDLTRGNGWRLALVLNLVLLVPGIVYELTPWLLKSLWAALSLTDSLTAGFLGTLVILTLLFAQIALYLQALATAYRALIAARG